jgi:hypothetical protein
LPERKAWVVVPNPGTGLRWLRADDGDPEDADLLDKSLRRLEKELLPLER